MLSLPQNARWSHNGVTLAGGNGCGHDTNQLDNPCGLDIDNDNQSIVIADAANHRIVEWKMGEKNGKVIAGGQGEGNRLNQMCFPQDVLIDKERNSLWIADQGNQRVLRWSRRQGMTQGEVIINSIRCCGLAMDHQRYLYVSDWDKHEVRRYRIGDENGIIVAGGNGQGNQLHQLNAPTYLFVDREQAVYVSDFHNHRVMKWNKGAREGIVIAGGQEEERILTQLSSPQGLFVDTSGTLYVADAWNNRVMLWPKGRQQGTPIVGKDKGNRANQLNWPMGLSFDSEGNLYVVDYSNHRVQRFAIQ